MALEDPRQDFEPDWPVCVRETSCRGAQAVDRLCMVHAEDLSGFSPGDDLDLRGARITPAKLAEVLGRFRDHEARRHVFGNVRCDHAWFVGRAWFDRATFTSGSFAYAHFSQRARFNFVECAEDMDFIGARFAGDVTLHTMSVKSLDLDRAWFANRVEINGWLIAVYCNDTRFEGGMTLTTAGRVTASGAHFGAPSTIEGAMLLSLEGSDVSNLVLTGVDLSECRFLGAHRLEQLRLDGVTKFALPKRWRAWRRMLVEEGTRDSARMAAVYRSLRKAFEDSKNEAGAGDFYYGEMECRRHAAESSLAERVILWCYWLLSGYGQRASRALMGLALVILVVTGLLTVWGQDFGMAARIAVGAVVFRDDRTELTSAGEWTVLVARFLGPVLLALAVLAIRARVKR